MLIQIYIYILKNKDWQRKSPTGIVLKNLMVIKNDMCNRNILAQPHMFVWSFLYISSYVGILHIGYTKIKILNVTMLFWILYVTKWKELSVSQSVGEFLSKLDIVLSHFSCPPLKKVSFQFQF